MPEKKLEPDWGMIERFCKDSIDCKTDSIISALMSDKFGENATQSLVQLKGLAEGIRELRVILEIPEKLKKENKEPKQ